MIRTATPKDAPRIHRLITANIAEGHLLPRTLADVTDHADRFVVATHRRRIVGCAELAPLSSSVAEVRSLVVDGEYRGKGISRKVVDEIRQRGARRGFEQLCAFTHDSAYFTHLGFTVVPHAAVPEKIAQDCRTCALFGQCGQFAVVAELSVPAQDGSAITALRV